ncbi:MAG TPA: substrate-binding domain-containing protein [Planctomycetota bacterium]|nr:substrate-binding domain-containing protein [Planctomycetota bacterium]
MLSTHTDRHPSRAGSAPHGAGLARYGACVAALLALLGACGDDAPPSAARPAGDAAAAAALASGTALPGSTAMPAPGAPAGAVGATEPAGASEPAGAASTGTPGQRLVIGLVAKSQSNPVFQAAYAGAKAAARELSASRGRDIVIDWQTPADEDPQRQAQAIEQLARAGAAGIAVSCSDANTLTPAIDKAVELGATVMCFDSDAPKSRRFAFFGTDDLSCGEAVMSELAAAMGEQGTIAILAGNASAPNLQRRVQGVRQELERHARMRLLDDGVFYHPETPEQAAETLQRAQSSHPEIGGWALVGGWPLFTRGALPWEPGAVKLVSVDALPAELAYLTSGHAEVLLAQDCFGWGHRSVTVLVEKILDGTSPPGAPRLIDPLTRVHKDDVRAWEHKWEEWLGP